MAEPVADIPKADLHMHAETRARLDRLVSRRENKAPHDWAEELRRLANVPPGWPRLVQGFAALSGDPQLDALDLDDEIFMEWLGEGLLEVAAQGVILVEIRFGKRWGIRPGFMSLFRDAGEAGSGKLSKFLRRGAGKRALANPA